ncbi:hypothetical protein VN12_04230 [Pirellula sp. SH-Sr6A]|uniref:hypothetical protein n=1 Tax=Pirellula sp. SH-Sr6A TaxID=1632865 RepID=UPI00078E3F44|nr:hypothetical protein [Pirellula sp. SH-Sr6A]AMV31300.1 hypothetical protein VN12_04230 [Pirellula sp. SH-Sr6A]
MGTRADFYIGTGENAEWLGSVAWDGYEWQEDNDCPLMKAATEQEFREAVAAIAVKRKDWTSPQQGWPWPWDNSFTTDRAYAFCDGKTQCFEFGELPSENEEDDLAKTVGWPNMKDRKNVTMGPRSGIMLFG